MGLDFHQFHKILKACNKDFRLFHPVSSRSSMIYLWKPSAEAALDNGLVEVLAYPSYLYFPTLPKYDFIDHTGKMNRGYATVFKMLVLKRLVRACEVIMFLPGALDSCRNRPEVKKNEKNNFSGLFKPIAVEPAGWEKSSRTIFA